MKLRVALLCVFLSLAACGTGEEPALEGGPQSPEPTQGPAVSITMPEDAAELPAGDVAIKVSVVGFDIVNKLGQAPVEGEGHIHFYRDVEDVPTAPGKPAVTDDETTYHAAATTEHTWSDVDAGAHSYSVQLVNNNHTPLEPPVVATVNVTVE